MRTLIFIAIFFLLNYCALGQVNEASSGVKKFNIGNQKSTVTEGQKPVEQKNEAVGASEKEIYMIKKKDENAPVITMISPIVDASTPIVVSDMRLLVTGEVKDESGILSVVVNTSEAVVTAEGKFQAEVLLAYGVNTIVIKAIDINKNIQSKSFMVERKAGEIRELPSPKNENQTAGVKINWLMNGQSPFSTTFESFKVKACIEAQGEITSSKLMNNGVLIAELTVNDLKFRGDCKFPIEQDIVLKSGANEIKIIVETPNGSTESLIMVNFSPTNARYYALIIGVDKYSDDKIQDLDQPVKDAAKLKEVLNRNYTFAESDITFLTNPTKSEIIGVLHELRKKLTVNDNLLIFYAGHGYWDEEMQLGYWLPSDANSDNPVNWIPNTDLTNYISAIKTKHTLLIADACFSGGIFKTRSAFNNQMALEKLMDLKSRKAMTSGTLTEVPDKSVFIEYLVRRLTENQNKYISSEQLFSEMRIAVINNSENIPQYGTIHNTGDEGGDFVFIKK